MRFRSAGSTNDADLVQTDPATYIIERRQEGPLMSLVVSQKIFNEGKAAKAAGKAFTDDPFRAGSQDSVDWLAGFTADEQGASMSGQNRDSREFRGGSATSG